MTPTNPPDTAPSPVISSAASSSSFSSFTFPDDSPEYEYDWLSEAINGGSLRPVDLDGGTNGWASPPGDLFNLRSKTYLRTRQKSPSGDWLLLPAGVDWLRSPARLDNVLARPDNRVAGALRRAQSRGRALKAFLVAVNLQVPPGGRDGQCRSAVFYFAADGERRQIRPGSLLYRFIHGDDGFRDSRFKLVNRIVRGPWIVRAAVGNYAACLLGKALRCQYHRGDGYLEIDVDIGSSAIANAVLRLALGYVTAVTIDMGFVVEGQEEEELPEQLFGAVRIAQMELSSATFVDTTADAAPQLSIPPQLTAGGGAGFRGTSKVVSHNNSSEYRGLAAAATNGRDDDVDESGEEDG